MELADDEHGINGGQPYKGVGELTGVNETDGSNISVSSASYSVELASPRRVESLLDTEADVNLIDEDDMLRSDVVPGSPSNQGFPTLCFGSSSLPDHCEQCSAQRSVLHGQHATVAS